MKGSIQLQWIKENRLHQKNIDKGKIEEIFTKTKELSEMIEVPISEIECIYINFDRNKKKNEEKIWIRYLQSEKSIDGKQYVILYLLLCDYCK